MLRNINFVRIMINLFVYKTGNVQFDRHVK
jgi:hypothetical protein